MYRIEWNTPRNKQKAGVILWIFIVCILLCWEGVVLGQRSSQSQGRFQTMTLQLIKFILLILIFITFGSLWIFQPSPRSRCIFGNFLFKYNPNLYKYLLIYSLIYKVLFYIGLCFFSQNKHVAVAKYYSCKENRMRLEILFTRTETWSL